MGTIIAGSPRFLASRWGLLALAGLLVCTALTSTPSRAVAGEPVAILTFTNSALIGEPQLQIEGTFGALALDGLDGRSSTLFSVLTDSGRSIDVTGDIPRGVVSGSKFGGTVAVPESVVKSARPADQSSLESSTGDPLAASSVAGQRVMQLFPAGAAPLEIVTGQFTAPVLASAMPLDHTLDIAVVNGVSFADVEVTSLVSGLNDFWAGQSNALISSVSQNDITKRFFTSVPDNCTNFSGVWDNAAVQFGHADRSFYDNGTGSHLIVISGADCAAGVGTVGSSLSMGGLVWANVDSNVDLHITAHEIGHNLGLGHSNLHKCNAAPRTEGTAGAGCYDYEYDDVVDVMGGAVSGVVNTNKLSALNIAHKVALGFIAPTDIQAVSAATTVVLMPISDASGLRGIEIPDGGDSYFLEYRSGTGMDAGNFYTDPSRSVNGVGFGLGVRVMKQRAPEAGYPSTSGESVAIVHQLFGSDTERRAVLQQGASFVTQGGMTVTVDQLTNTAATLSLQPITVQQTYGADRYATAVALSQQGYASGANVVYVAQGANYPDALGAAPAAASQGAPLLLTPFSSLPNLVIDEIIRLNPTRIVVVGGEGVVSAFVFSQLQALVADPAEVVRLAGADRYATARAVVRYAYIATGVPLPTIAYIATGTNYPDALSAAAAGGAIGAPVVLVNGAAGSLDVATVALLDELGVNSTRIAGGTASVSNGIQSDLAAFTAVSRYAGTDRYQTSQLLNAAAFSAGTDQVFIATGLQFPDALSGAALAGAVAAPLYVVPTTCIPSQSKTDIIAGTPILITLVGGPGVLAASVKTLTSC